MAVNTGMLRTQWKRPISNEKVLGKTEITMKLMLKIRNGHNSTSD